MVLSTNPAYLRVQEAQAGGGLPGGWRLRRSDLLAEAVLCFRCGLYAEQHL